MFDIRQKCSSAYIHCRFYESIEMEISSRFSLCFQLKIFHFVMTVCIHLIFQLTFFFFFNIICRGYDSNTIIFFFLFHSARILIILLICCRPCVYICVWDMQQEIFDKDMRIINWIDDPRCRLYAVNEIYFLYKNNYAQYYCSRISPRYCNAMDINLTRTFFGFKYFFFFLIFGNAFVKLIKLN